MHALLSFVDEKNAEQNGHIFVRSDVMMYVFFAVSFVQMVHVAFVHYGGATCLKQVSILIDYSLYRCMEYYHAEY